MLRQRTDGSLVEQVGNRDLGLQNFLQLRMNRDEQQRIAAEVKKILVQPDVFYLQYFFPKAGDSLFEFRLWLLVRRVDGCRLWTRQRCAIDFTVRTERKRG